MSHKPEARTRSIERVAWYFCTLEVFYALITNRFSKSKRRTSGQRLRRVVMRSRALHRGDRLAKARRIRRQEVTVEPD